MERRREEEEEKVTARSVTSVGEKEGERERGKMHGEEEEGGCKRVTERRARTSKVTWKGKKYDEEERERKESFRCAEKLSHCKCQAGPVCKVWRREQCNNSYCTFCISLAVEREIFFCFISSLLFSFSFFLPFFHSDTCTQRVMCN